MIQHADGNISLYAHLYENSITVSAGDQVGQGQVIGKWETVVVLLEHIYILK